MKKWFIALCVASLVLTTISNSTLSRPNYLQTTSPDKAELQKKIDEYEKKLGELRNEKTTLASQIQYMDTQIYITGLRAEETKNKIEKTEYEIDTLGEWITNLNDSLDGLSESLLNRIIVGYKTRQASVIDVVFDSSSATDMVNKLKYYQMARDSNKRVLLEVQEAKLNYEEQKKLREKKKDELAKLQVTLLAQQEDLKRQQEAKRTLLQVTQSDESTYSRLLSEAKRQIAAYKSFVQSTGVGTIAAGSLGTGEGGWYLSQRDERWAGAQMGGSSESVLDVGCFVTSISMVMRFYGADFTPLSIASSPSYFLPGSAYMYLPSTFNGSWPNGKSYKNISYSEVDSYLSRNVPVIAGVNGSSHYVVLKKKDGDELIMNDPIYGPDLKVSDHYNLSGPYGVFE